MIHQVNPPKTAVELLGNIVNLQLYLLKLAAMHSTVDEALIQKEFPENLSSDVAETAKWIARKETWLSNLNKFASYKDNKEKQKLVSEIEADIALLYSPAPQMLKVVIRKDAPKWRNGLREFCLRFFELWRTDTKDPGFPACLFPAMLCPTPSFSRWDYLDRFQQANSELYLCAICDISIYRTQVGHRAFASIEHFFPKSYYPHLAIHPYNLVPICPFCNSEASDRDIMALCDATHGISEILLPYSQSRVGFMQEAYIEIKQRSSSEPDDRAEIHPLEIKFRSAQGHNAERSLQIFNTIYKIEERWNNELDQIGEHVFRRIQQFLLGDVQMGNHLSDCVYLIDKLKGLMAITERDNLGKDPYGFATVWMLNYFIQQLEGERENALIFKELKK